MGIQSHQLQGQSSLLYKGQETDLLLRTLTRRSISRSSGLDHGNGGNCEVTLSLGNPVKVPMACTGSVQRRKSMSFCFVGIPDAAPHWEPLIQQGLFRGTIRRLGAARGDRYLLSFIIIIVQEISTFTIRFELDQISHSCTSLTAFGVCHLSNPSFDGTSDIAQTS